MTNVVVIGGNVVSDPQEFSNGNVVKFTIANDVKYGEKSTTSFVEVTVFGKLGGVIKQHCPKGTPIMVRGRLKQDQWEDAKSGQKRSRIGIIMEGFDFLGGDKPNRSAGNQRSNSAPSAPSGGGNIPF